MTLVISACLTAEDPGARPGWTGAHGLGDAAVTDDQRVLWCLPGVISLLPFLDDGFLRSVRQRHVG